MARPHIQADEIRQLERAHGMAVAQFHCTIDVFDGGDTALQHTNRFGPEHDAEATGGKPRRVVDHDRRLAESLGKAATRIDGFLTRVKATDELEQRHRRWRVKEVRSDHAVPAAELLAQLRDRQTGKYSIRRVPCPGHVASRFGAPRI